MLQSRSRRSLHERDEIRDRNCFHPGCVRPALVVALCALAASAGAGGVLFAVETGGWDKGSAQTVLVREPLVRSSVPSTIVVSKPVLAKGFAPLRDRFELALTRRAIQRDMPVLGICRGMQLLNVACGGTLVQHVPDLVGHEEHRRTPGSFDGSAHDVRLDPGSLAANAAGELRHLACSHHHQGVDRIGDGLVVTGHSTLDELPEALEATDRAFVLGVQWHPEADETSPVVDSLVAAALDYRRGAADRGALLGQRDHRVDLDLGPAR